MVLSYRRPLLAGACLVALVTGLSAIALPGAAAETDSADVTTEELVVNYERLRQTYYLGLSAKW